MARIRKNDMNLLSGLERLDMQLPRAGKKAWWTALLPGAIAAAVCVISVACSSQSLKSSENELKRLERSYEEISNSEEIIKASEYADALVSLENSKEIIDGAKTSFAACNVDSQNLDRLNKIINGQAEVLSCEYGTDEITLNLFCRREEDIFALIDSLSRCEIAEKINYSGFSQDIQNENSGFSFEIVLTLKTEKGENYSE